MSTVAIIIMKITKPTFSLNIVFKNIFFENFQLHLYKDAFFILIDI